jgi:hypothetical protein
MSLVEGVEVGYKVEGVEEVEGVEVGYTVEVIRCIYQ